MALVPPARSEVNPIQKSPSRPRTPFRDSFRLADDQLWNPLLYRVDDNESDIVLLRTGRGLP